MAILGGWLGWAGLPVAILVFVSGCGDDGGGPSGTGGAAGGGGGGGGAGAGAGPVVETLHPSAQPLAGETECVVTITTQIPIAGQAHVEPCTEVAYATNPPSSGDHWGVWASFLEYDDEIPREMYVHSMEHGAVVFLHDCAGCAEVVPAFNEVIDGFGADPLCAIQGIQNRTIIAPDSAIDTPIAVAAWGATYTATCIDPPSLAAFLEAHYAKGPENLCAEGKDPTDPLGGAPVCD